MMFIISKQNLKHLSSTYVSTCVHTYKVPLLKQIISTIYTVIYSFSLYFLFVEKKKKSKKLLFFVNICNLL